MLPLLSFGSCDIPISGAKLRQLKVSASFSTVTFVLLVDKIMFMFHSIFDDPKPGLFRHHLQNVKML